MCLSVCLGVCGGGGVGGGGGRGCGRERVSGEPSAPWAQGCRGAGQPYFEPKLKFSADLQRRSLSTVPPSAATLPVYTKKHGVGGREGTYVYMCEYTLTHTAHTHLGGNGTELKVEDMHMCAYTHTHTHTHTLQTHTWVEMARSWRSRTVGSVCCAAGSSSTVRP